MVAKSTEARTDSNLSPATGGFRIRGNCHRESPADMIYWNLRLSMFGNTAIGKWRKDRVGHVSLGYPDV